MAAASREAVPSSSRSSANEERPALPGESVSAPERRARATETSGMSWRSMRNTGRPFVSASWVGMGARNSTAVPEGAAARGTKSRECPAAARLRRAPALAPTGAGPLASPPRKRPGARPCKGAPSSPASRRSLLLLGQHDDHHALLVVEVLLRDLLDLGRRRRERRIQVFREHAGVLGKHFVVVELIALAAEAAHALQLGKEAGLEISLRPRQLLRRGRRIAQSLHLVGEGGNEFLGRVPGLYRRGAIDKPAELHRRIPGGAHVLGDLLLVDEVVVQAGRLAAGEDPHQQGCGWMLERPRSHVSDQDLRELHLVAHRL